MIIRLMNEGQFQVGDDVLQQLDRLDDEAVAALEEGDEETLDARLASMWELVQSQGGEIELESDVGTGTTIRITWSPRIAE